MIWIFYKLGESHYQLILLSVNGLIAKPATYTLSNSIVTFAIPPLSNTKVIAMYYDRASYSGSFVLDQIGDEVKTFGTGYSGLGVHTFVSGVTNAIQVQVVVSLLQHLEPHMLLPQVCWLLRLVLIV